MHFILCGGNRGSVLILEVGEVVSVVVVWLVGWGWVMVHVLVSWRGLGFMCVLVY